VAGGRSRFPFSIHHRSGSQSTIPPACPSISRSIENQPF
jgi:hypothetical protein